MSVRHLGDDLAQTAHALAPHDGIKRLVVDDLPHVPQVERERVDALAADVLLVEFVELGRRDAVRLASHVYHEHLCPQLREVDAVVPLHRRRAHRPPAAIAGVIGEEVGPVDAAA